MCSTYDPSIKMNLKKISHYAVAGPSDVRAGSKQQKQVGTNKQKITLSSSHDRRNNRLISISRIRHDSQSSFRCVDNYYTRSAHFLRGESLHAEGTPPSFDCHEHACHARLTTCCRRKDAGKRGELNTHKIRKGARLSSSLCPLELPFQNNRCSLLYILLYAQQMQYLVVPLYRLLGVAELFFMYLLPSQLMLHYHDKKSRGVNRGPVGGFAASIPFSVLSLYLHFCVLIFPERHD